MDWLLLDAQAQGRCRVGWLNTSGRVTIMARCIRPAGLMRHLFVHHGSRLRACGGICVVAGPGSFSRIRIGVLQANLLARLLRLPLVGVTSHEAGDLLSVAKRLDSWPRCEYVVPVYDREPNITQGSSIQT